MELLIRFVTEEEQKLGFIRFKTTVETEWLNTGEFGTYDVSVAIRSALDKASALGNLPTNTLVTDIDTEAM